MHILNMHLGQCGFPSFARNNNMVWSPPKTSLFLPPYSPFLNPIEELFSAWRWKVYDHQPHDQMSLLEAMDAGCRDITVHDCQGWIRHTKRFYPRCITLDNIRCDVTVMKTCGLTLKIAVIRYSNFVLFLAPPPFLSGLFAVVFLFRMLLCVSWIFRSL